MSSVPAKPPVRAAGGLVWRVVDEGIIEVLLVHRPAAGYDDWTLPKGKVEATDPDDEHAALREVEEETGYRCTLGRELPSVGYHLPSGRPKVVRYWEMRVIGGGFAPNREIDAVVWLDPGDARRRLTYDHDRAVIDAFMAYAAGTRSA